jgi:transcription initiation factor TFIID TATA-box-binding protein
VLYEPEQFPGAVYRMDVPKVVFLIFSAGKLVCVGAKKEQDVYEAVAKLQAILEENDLIFYPD